MQQPDNLPQNEIRWAITLLELVNQKLTHIEGKVHKIMASQGEEAAALAAIKAQLAKAKDEIVTKIQALVDAVAAAGNTSPEVDAATADLQAVAQALDDIVPDA